MPFYALLDSNVALTVLRRPRFCFRIVFTTAGYQWLSDSWRVAHEAKHNAVQTKRGPYPEEQARLISMLYDSSCQVPPTLHSETFILSGLGHLGIAFEDLGTNNVGHSFLILKSARMSYGIAI